MNLKTIRNPKKTAFGKEYAKFVCDRIPSTLTKKQVDFIIKKTKLKSGAHVLDIGCGNGRHSLEFARRGYVVTGIDESSELLAIARKEAMKEKLSVKFIKKDMTDISFINKFDLIISMFSFGFLEKRDMHQLIIEKISRSLKSGGVCVLATGNALPRIRNAKRKKIKEKNSRYVVRDYEKTETGGLVISTRETIDTRTMKQTIRKKWRENGLIHTSSSSIYLFSPSEIKKMLKNENLVLSQTFGDFEGNPFRANSQRFLIFSKKY